VPAGHHTRYRTQNQRWFLPSALADLLALTLGLALFWNRDLEPFGSDELGRVSPYLSRGARSGGGKDPAFVGTIGEDWFALEASAETWTSPRSS